MTRSPSSVASWTLTIPPAPPGPLQPPSPSPVPPPEPSPTPPLPDPIPGPPTQSGRAAAYSLGLQNRLPDGLGADLVRAVLDEVRLFGPRKVCRSLGRRVVMSDRVRRGSVARTTERPSSLIPQRVSAWFASGFSSMSWIRLPHVSSKTATTAAPMSVGGCVNTTPLLTRRECSASMSLTAN